MKNDQAQQFSFLQEQEDELKRYYSEFNHKMICVSINLFYNLRILKEDPDEFDRDKFINDMNNEIPLGSNDKKAILDKFEVFFPQEEEEDIDNYKLFKCFTQFWIKYIQKLRFIDLNLLFHSISWCLQATNFINMFDIISTSEELPERASSLIEDIYLNSSISIYIINNQPNEEKLIIKEIINNDKKRNVETPILIFNDSSKQTSFQIISLTKILPKLNSLERDLSIEEDVFNIYSKKWDTKNNTNLEDISFELKLSKQQVSIVTYSYYQIINDKQFGISKMTDDTNLFNTIYSGLEKIISRGWKNEYYPELFNFIVHMPFIKNEEFGNNENMRIKLINLIFDLSKIRKKDSKSILGYSVAYVNYLISNIEIMEQMNDPVVDFYSAFNSYLLEILMQHSLFGPYSVLHMLCNEYDFLKMFHIPFFPINAEIIDKDLFNLNMQVIESFLPMYGPTLLLYSYNESMNSHFLKLAKNWASIEPIKLVDILIIYIDILLSNDFTSNNYSFQNYLDFVSLFMPKKFPQDAYGGNRISDSWKFNDHCPNIDNLVENLINALCKNKYGSI